MVVTRRAALVSLAAAAQGDPRGWVPGRRKLGPVTHVVGGGDTAGVRTLRNVRWPGLQTRRDDGSFAAGPSGPPWINTNAWAIQYERYRMPGAPVWVATPKPESLPLTTEDYLVALADCEASGARWVIDADEAALPRIAEAVKFFDAHRGWREFQPPRHIGLVATAQPEMREVMNLLSRFATPYRLVSAPLPGMLVLIVYGPPDTAAHAFASQGGLVMSLGWKSMIDRATGDGAWVETRPHMRTGAGWLAAWRGPVGNAQQFVKDVQARLGETHTLVKAYNLHASTVRCTVSEPDGRALVQLVNFNGRPWEEETTVWVQHIAARAVLHQWNRPPQPIDANRHRGGTELVIPRRDLYAAIELFPA